MRAEDHYTRMAALSASGTPFVEATVIGVEGSSPRGVGASMLVLSDGATFGTIGGGVLEHQATRDALEHLRSGASQTQTYRLAKRGEHAVGARCGGEVQVFFNVHSPRETLLVFGAGHVGRQLCALAELLDYRSVVIDSRPEMLTREQLPAASELICADRWVPEHCPITASTSIVVVTHAAELDRDGLRSVLGTDAGYIGMMGSRRKIASVFRELEAEGVGIETLSRVRAPIGLDIGAETPAELALCIMAEIVAARSGRNASAKELDPRVEGAAGQEASLHA
jgi:xanthine dehydrogenase accessory factor